MSRRSLHSRLDKLDPGKQHSTIILFQKLDGTWLHGNQPITENDRKQLEGDPAVSLIKLVPHSRSGQGLPLN